MVGASGVRENPPLTPPRRGTDLRRSDAAGDVRMWWRHPRAGSPPWRGEGWVFPNVPNITNSPISVVARPGFAGRTQSLSTFIPLIQVVVAAVRLAAVWMTTKPLPADEPRAMNTALCHTLQSVAQRTRPLQCYPQRRRVTRRFSRSADGPSSAAGGDRGTRSGSPTSLCLGERCGRGTVRAPWVAASPRCAALRQMRHSAWHSAFTFNTPAGNSAACQPPPHSGNP